MEERTGIDAVAVPPHSGIKALGAWGPSRAADF